MSFVFITVLSRAVVCTRALLAAKTCPEVNRSAHRAADTADGIGASTGGVLTPPERG
jgi:hypothetical protein